MKAPRDKTPCLKDRGSALTGTGLTDGLYVYVQDGMGIVPVGGRRARLVLNAQQELTGDPCLPGFRVAVVDIFRR